MASLAPAAELDAAGIEPAAPAVLVVDGDRRCVEANRAATTLLGRAHDEILGTRIESLMAREMRDRIRYIWAAFKVTGGSAGPVTLRGGGEVQVWMTEDVVPGRHLIVLSPVSAGMAPAQPATPLAAVEPMARPPRSAGRSPSARECDVLRLLASGSTDPQIAAQLGLSPATVQTHVRNAKAKLGASTRAQAVAMAIKRRLIVLG